MNNDKMISFFKQHYSKRLKRALKNRGYKNSEILKKQYRERFLKYMSDADFGSNNERFTSYLNIYSGLVADLLPNGFIISANSVKEDMIGVKSVCWETEVIEDSEQRFEYRITKCLYFDVCKAHGYPEFTKVFCTHDRYAYEVLHRHAKFIRYSAIGEGGDCCHDTFVKVK